MLGQLCRKLSFLALLTSAAFGQSQNANLSGQVTDTSGASVPGARVTITAVGLQVNAVVTTDNDGRFSFPNLAPGTYNLAVEAQGFRSYVQSGIQLLANSL